MKTIILYLCALCAFAVSGNLHAAEIPKIVILAFDGADMNLTKQWIEAGHLPNLDKLQKIGCFKPLVPPYPPQTPVSWASFATGKNPGKTTIFDFLKRDPKTYMPDFAMNSVSKQQVLWGKRTSVIIAPSIGAVLFLVIFFSLFFTQCTRITLLASSIGSAVSICGVLFFLIDLYLPQEKPIVINNRQGKTIWELATTHGIKTRVIRFPNTFPPDTIEDGEILSGLGVPDIRGTMGTFSYYTNEVVEQNKDTEMGGKVIQVKFSNNKAETIIYGPRNKLFKRPPGEINLSLMLELVQSTTNRSENIPPLSTPLQGVDEGGVRNLSKKESSENTHLLKIEASGQTQILKEGEWSDWFVLEFSFNLFIKMYGIARFYVISIEPLKLYMSPVNFHPRHPPLPISYPKNYAGDIAKNIGLYKTLGWAIDTWALNEERIDEDIFLDDTNFTVNKEIEMLKIFLEKQDVRLYIQLFEFTDRIQHMFWRFREEDHPAYDREKAEKYKGVIFEYYKKMDEIVGLVMEKLDDKSILFVCSDHGFNSFKKAVNYNTWLVKNKYMALTSEGDSREKTLEDLFGRGQFWPNVDWDNTKAYALGLGDIYINLEGREAYGIVRPGRQYEKLRNEIKEKLEAWVDDKNGQRPVRRVYKREEVYKGFDPNLVPDLIVANNNGYRVSWQTSLGGIPKDILEDNKKNWSADHCSLDPEITKGIFLSNLKFDVNEANIVDIFPTILQLLNIPIPDDVDGKALK
ncbi:MAG TPA: alkaline phosphatase family protein [Candidatus Wunengus sp. YC60]|uniref:alkaline phosphatase family protein n=1 Tax=Candidatus Wunengus sp. YC60 TaxID=3367697 RepID=UPI004024EDF7